MQRVSIIIANYNYEKYVAASIESALASDWPNVEVIVVDDGSTDNSRAVIDGFGDRIAKIYNENGRQRVANNTGFAHATGDIIIFLDADDLILPSAARKICEIWRPGVSKVQVQMLRIDENGTTFGAPFPEWGTVPTPQDIRTWALTTTEYPTPPGSGNAYARDFLEKFFPVGPQHDDFTDSTCLVMAPILGDVLTIREPLVLYRRHGSNDSNLLANSSFLAREVKRAMLRQQSAAEICGKLGITPPPDDILRRSWYVLQLRVASLRTAPTQHPLPGDSRWQALYDAATNIVRPSAEPFKRRLKYAAWSIATLLAPDTLAGRLVSSRFGEKKAAA